MLVPIDNNSIVPIDPPDRRMAREPISEDEYKLIKEAIPYGDVNARLYFEALRNTGCRAVEIRRITPAHIGQNGPEVWLEIRRGKTREKDPFYVRVWLNPVLGQQLLAYVRGHRIQWNELIFPRTHQRYWQIWHAASLKAIGRCARIHDIRGVHARHLFRKGATPAQVAALLGHKNINVTLSHYNQMDAADRREIGESTPI
jgi:integrase